MKFAILVAAFLAILATHAGSQEGAPRVLVCKSLNEWRAGLKTRYGEVPAVAAMAAARPMLILANTETGTWTMLAIYPDRACIIGAGNSFKIFMQGDPA